ncbi:cob(I)yrinic acid a,c-diamide adenosyltransferase [uncultured Rhodospira sp.]|mgnify:CR=1 FL=1|uniref:cob(I)yrinic acid a,c-diamide adenosyltransferase n=1 Tax=uncultured Rhodospira sp. TaxID=1936189 RepID=UPI00345A13E7
MSDESPDPEATDDDDADVRHSAKMRKKKAARDRMMAGKSGEKGLLIVHTGPGKGKSSAAFGMVLRCIGHGMPVGIVQFIKGAMDTAERTVLEGYPDLVTIRAMGEGFTWETQDRARDVAAAERAWAVAADMMADPKPDAPALLDLPQADLALFWAGDVIVVDGEGVPSG